MLLDNVDSGDLSGVPNHLFLQISSEEYLAKLLNTLAL